MTEDQLFKPQTPLYIAADIYDRFKVLVKGGMPLMKAYEQLGEEFGKPPSTIRLLMQRFRPRTDLARAFLKASALRMAKKIVTHGDPGHMIDVLSRSNIGVLAPKTEGGQGGGGFFLSVQAESCGAVKVGVMQAQPLPQLESSDNPFEEQTHGPNPAESAVSVTKQVNPYFGRKSAEAIDNARRRLEEARQRRDRAQRGRAELVTGGEGDQGLQGPDGDAEAEG